LSRHGNLGKGNMPEKITNMFKTPEDMQDFVDAIETTKREKN
jgi:hypothetical protein